MNGKVGWFNLTVIAAISFVLIIALLLLAWRNHKTNYTDPHGGRTQGNHSDLAKAFDGTLRVVTWNLHFGEKLDKIIATLENTNDLHEPDLLLLQEIDAEGVDRIARHLRYNYIFYPTVFSHQRGRNTALRSCQRGLWRLPKEFCSPIGCRDGWKIVS